MYVFIFLKSKSHAKGWVFESRLRRTYVSLKQVMKDLSTISAQWLRAQIKNKHLMTWKIIMGVGGGTPNPNQTFNQSIEYFKNLKFQIPVKIPC